MRVCVPVWTCCYRQQKCEAVGWCSQTFAGLLDIPQQLTLQKIKLVFSILSLIKLPNFDWVRPVRVHDRGDYRCLETSTLLLFFLLWVGLIVNLLDKGVLRVWAERKEGRTDLKKTFVPLQCKENMKCHCCCKRQVLHICLRKWISFLVLSLCRLQSVAQHLLSFSCLSKSRYGLTLSSLSSLSALFFCCS